MIQHHLNSHDPLIQFEIELPEQDGFLPYLNTKIKANTSGEVERGWYTNPAKKGFMLNAKSHHPEYIKRAVIDNTIKTYTSISSKISHLMHVQSYLRSRKYI